VCLVRRHATKTGHRMQHDRKGNENTTAISESKIMRTIFGPITENDAWDPHQLIRDAFV